MSDGRTQQSSTQQLHVMPVLELQLDMPPARARTHARILHRHHRRVRARNARAHVLCTDHWQAWTGAIGASQRAAENRDRRVTCAKSGRQGSSARTQQSSRPSTQTDCTPRQS